MAGIDVLRSWEARDWTELFHIWDELFPDLDDDFDDEKGEPQRLFRGQALEEPSEKGYVLERWISEAFRLSGADFVANIRVAARDGGVLEEIDGFVFLDWQAFLVETKAWTKPVDFAPIAVFQFKVETRPAGSLGLFFALKGYTSSALESASMYRPRRVLLLEGVDIHRWLRRNRDMLGLVRRRWTFDAQSGQRRWSVNET